MQCDRCETKPRYTLRAKSAPGQWHILGKACEAHLLESVEAAREQRPELAAELQVVPFVARHWK
jgi:hypothetical protein